MEIILQAFWLLLPAGIANMSPVLVKWLPFLDLPVDLGKEFKGKPLFGKNKTYRGFLFGTLMAILVVYIQSVLFSHTLTWTLLDYSNANVFILGFLLGFGALLGDLIESFFKRQAGIVSGKSWFPFDQIDWIVGSLLLASFYVSIPLKVIVVSILLFGMIHPVVNLLGYYLGIKKNKF